MAYKEIRADLIVGAKQKYSLVVSRFNSFITDQLLSGAKDAFVRHGGKEDQLTVVYVPGSMELPLVAQKMAKSNSCSAVICLGTVIRGDTPHFEYVASEAAKGIAQVSLQTGVPVIFGVITADTLEQAIDRAGVKSGNKGADAMMTAIEMVNVLQAL